MLHQAMEAYSDGLESVLRGLLKGWRQSPPKPKTDT